MDFILAPLLLIIQVYIWIIIISAIVSILQINPRQPAVEILRRLTEPAFSYVRQKLPFVVVRGVDLSPLVLVIGLQLISSLLSGNILLAIIGILSSIIYAYIILVIIAVVLSYLNVDQYNPIVQTIKHLTNPPLQFIRQKLPFLVISGIDLSPLVLIFSLQAMIGLLGQLSQSIGI
ncbi:MAG: Integral membrane protein YggT, involved in response to extracytoplasmic stress (osmotic shock) [uncultured Sulfurovum sp.]|uniref:Integral membrane protein YggT, involved in response to extracytoplasmic stress (Osmotic shock) n=1 Tax=uncultured Sulfurovum sp. TaxID=269237 RepID=A0A6S6U3P9_9BACT|nr:MAG: Integral membrane protein YggT, involved in response to extracytoplasmic stress (osmotic shock) [uncultured Sulfurovum sp.]